MAAGPLPSASALLERLRAQANPDNVAGMARYGISSEGTLGVSLPFLRGIAAETRAERRADPEGAHELARMLWGSRVHEARMLASLLDIPGLVTRQQAEAWIADVDSWDVCDGLCNNLLDKTPFAYEMATRWAGAEAEFTKRAGFVLMCTRALHDKAEGDETFLHFLALVEREAADDRPMVKKAVNWALRQIGKRNHDLHGAAVVVALRLRDSGSKAARARVAADALRELGDEKIVARIRP